MKRKSLIKSLYRATKHFFSREKSFYHLGYQEEKSYQEYSVEEFYSNQKTKLGTTFL